MDCQKYGESDILSGENLEKSLGLKDEIPEEEGKSNLPFFHSYLVNHIFGFRLALFQNLTVIEIQGVMNLDLIHSDMVLRIQLSV